LDFSSFGWSHLPKEDYEAVQKIFKLARGYQIEALKYTLDSYNDFICSQNNLVFHLIGDHPTFMGEIDNWFGNPSGNINMENSKEHLKTMWLTNQSMPDSDEYVVGDFYDHIKRLLV